MTWLYDVVDQENSWPILCVKANELTHQLVTFIAQFMKNGIDINYGEDFYKMVFDSLKQLSSRSEFLEKVEENILYNLINTLLHLLLHADEQKNNIKDKNQQYSDF